MKKVTSLVAVGLLTAASANAVTINEAVMNDISTDSHEFVELCGSPGESLTGLTLVLIEGEGATAKGTIDRAIALTGPIPADGYWVVGDAAVAPDQAQAVDWIENGGQTILIVQGFSSSVGTDIDVNNDGIADGPIGTIIDGVGVRLPSDGDAVYYSAPALGPDTGDTGTANFDVAGVVRCVDCTGAWGMICLNGTEPTGPGCNTSNAFNPYYVPYASPGLQNTCPPVSVDPNSWGKVKAGYR